MAKPKTRKKPSSTRATADRTALERELVDAADRTTLYALEVLEGVHVAGPHVRNACRRHLDDLVLGAARGLHYDLAAAKHVWSYFENVLKLSEGQFEGRPFLLHPVQAFKLGSLFGWKRDDGCRRFRRAYIEEGKGNGKSPFAAGVGLYMMTADKEPGAEIYAVGADKNQASVLFRDAVKMVRKSPALAKRLRFSGGEGKEYNIAQLKTGSFFRPLTRTASKSGSGPRPHCGLADEIHEHPSRDAVEMVERGFKFRRNPLLLQITNSGSDRKSFCWEEHQHAVRVAAGTRTPDDVFAYVGEPIDDSTFSFVCALDKGDDPLNDPSCWPKANPLLGVILQPEDLERVVKQARDMPGKLNGILRLHFCVWTDSETAWISRETLEKVLADFDAEEHRGREIAGAGVDLSRVRDLTAAAFVVQTGTVERTFTDELGDVVTLQLPTFDAWIEAWTPLDTLPSREMADSAPYGVWVAQGWLNAPPGARVDYYAVAGRLAAVDLAYGIRLLAYDRYAYRADFEPALESFGASFPTAEHPQGGRRKARPTDDQVAFAKSLGLPAPEGLWFPGSLAKLEALILDGRIRLLNNPVLVSACMSAMVVSDDFDNRWFSKQKSTQKIDPLVALTMAVGAALQEGVTAPTSPWEDPNFKLKKAA